MSTPRVLLGRYEVGEVIGSGATADVHRARDMRSGQAMAVKVMRRHLATDPLSRSRFHREAATAAKLSHPAIVTIYDTGYEEVDGGSAGRIRVPFIAMEHVEGRSLRKLLDARGALTLAETIHYQTGILTALDHAHRAGVIHRDIKPANVIVTSTAAVKIVDFGIARSRTDPAETWTQSHAFLGTPSYFSPEQARGETADASSDLYSAGCLLYEMLTGQPPFVGDDPVSVVYQHVHEMPAPAATTIKALDVVVAKALAKDPQDRFPNAGAFRGALLAATRCALHVHPGALAHTIDHSHGPLAAGSRAGAPQAPH